jgi:hypothetical protein
MNVDHVLRFSEVEAVRKMARSPALATVKAGLRRIGPSLTLAGATEIADSIAAVAVKGVPTGDPVARSHTCTDLSSPPETMTGRPSSSATATTYPPCPRISWWGRCSRHDAHRGGLLDEVAAWRRYGGVSVRMDRPVLCPPSAVATYAYLSIKCRAAVRHCANCLVRERAEFSLGGVVRMMFRAAGWGLVAFGAIASTVFVMVGAFNAHSDAAFNRWVGWANIGALGIAVFGFVAVLCDKLTGAVDPDTEREAVENLHLVVLSQAQAARSQLIGAGEPGAGAANVPFVRHLQFRGVGGASDGDLASVLDYYLSLSPRRLVVLGEPGAGKTVLALQLQVRLLEARVGAPGAPVPVLVSAAAYDGRQPWEAWFARHLADRFGIHARVAARLVRDRQVLPLIDGLDEMDPAGTGDPQRAQALAGALNAAMHGLDRAPLVVTCRRKEYADLRPGIDSATCVKMTGLRGGEAADYLRGQLRTQAEAGRWRSVLASLDQEPGGPLAVQMATPWRLTLALAAFRGAGHPSALLPVEGVAESEYARYLDSILLASYVPSAVRRYSPDTPYTEQRVHKWLTALADGLVWQSRHDRSPANIVLHEWWRPAGQNITRAAHMIIAILPAIAVFIAAAVTKNTLLKSIRYDLLLACICFPLMEIPPLQGSIRGVLRRHGLRRLVTGLSIGFTSGLVIGLVLGLAVGLVFGFAPGFAGLAGWLVSGTAVGVIAGVAFGIADGVPKERGPRGVIRANGDFVLTTELVFGLSFGLTGWLGTTLVAGLSFGLVLGFVVAGGAWTRYHVAVALMAARRQGPLQLGAFLDWAVGAGLLRVSGNAYQFRHRQLQDWLGSFGTVDSSDPLS